MSSTGMNLAFELPARRDLPAERSDAIRRLLEDTVAGEPSVRRRRRRLRLTLLPAGALVAASTVAATVLVVGDVGTGTDEAATAAAAPPVLAAELNIGAPARAELLDLATRAAAAEVQPYAAAEPTVSTESWNLVVSEIRAGATIPDGYPEGAAAEVRSEAGGAGFSTYVVPVLRDLRFLPDGSVHVRETHGSPRFPTAELNEDDYAIAGTVFQDETLAPGEYAVTFPQELPTEPAPLRDLLLSNRPQAEDLGAALIQAVHELITNRPVDMPVQAAALTMLASEPDVVALGETIDRRGRDVVAFGADDSGAGSRVVLMVDPVTGRIAGYEQLLTSDVPEIGLLAPLVMAYTVFL